MQEMLTAGSSTFTYDDKGNTRFETNGGTVTQYTWDIQNRLMQWQKTNQTTENYVYNADGMRVRKTVGGTQTDFLLDINEIAEEMTGSSVASYVGPGLISKIDGTSRAIYHADGIGSTRAISDVNQAVAQAEVYDAYGNRLTTSSPAPTFGYAGQYGCYADMTGLDYLEARYYNPTVGRFTQRGSPYTYAGNNPMSTGMGKSPGRKIGESGAKQAIAIIIDAVRGKGCFPIGKLLKELDKLRHLTPKARKELTDACTPFAEEACSPDDDCGHDDTWLYSTCNQCCYAMMDYLGYGNMAEIWCKSKAACGKAFPGKGSK